MAVNYLGKKFHDIGKGTAHFKKCKKDCLNANIYSYLATSGGQNSNLF
jgi:hypothetical protein